MVWTASLIIATAAAAAATLGVFAWTGVAPLPASGAARRAAARLLGRHEAALDGATVYDLSS